LEIKKSAMPFPVDFTATREKSKEVSGYLTGIFFRVSTR
jgi:hypothetical protein